MPKKLIVPFALATIGVPIFVLYSIPRLPAHRSQLGCRNGSMIDATCGVAIGETSTHETNFAGAKVDKTKTADAKLEIKIILFLA